MLHSIERDLPAFPFSCCELGCGSNNWALHWALAATLDQDFALGLEATAGSKSS